MKADLTSGEIVTLAKECDCITHNEPHWVYCDRLHRERNRKLLDPEGKTPEQRWYGIRGVAIEESVRLAEKVRNFKRLGITQLITEPEDELTDIQRQQLKKHYETMRPPEPEKPAVLASIHAAIKVSGRKAHGGRKRTAISGLLVRFFLRKCHDPTPRP